MKKQSYILKQLFDVRPMTSGGALHWNRILQVKKHLNLRAAASKPALKIKLAPERDGSVLPDGRLAQEVFAPILTNYYQPKSKSADLSSVFFAEEQLSSDGQREKIMSELEVFLSGKHISPSHIIPIRQIGAGTAIQAKSPAKFFPIEKQPLKKSAKLRVGGLLAGALALLAGGVFLFFGYQGVSIQKKQLPAAGGLAVIEKNTKIVTPQENLGIPEYASEILSLLDGGRDQNILILFQNPAKIRATGGFIEKYGIITINDGKITKILTDNIFNLDGQLREKIIPPLPLQKISTAWSAHDSNWFLDFSASAKKAAQFYEMASGERASAVVALNPSALVKLLAISSTFEGIFSDKENLPKIVRILEESAKTKDAMFYFADAKAQELVALHGFDGRVLKSQDDYLAVALASISGSAVGNEQILTGSIDLKSEVAKDGQITNALTIEYPAGIGADFARVYAPLGARLIDVKGQTFKNIKAPIDYQKSGFENDRDVNQIESSLATDKKTGTYIYEESGKTVFANWVDVNSKKSAKITYEYILPVRFNFDDNFDGDYQMIFQKQSGSETKLNWQIDFPESIKIYSGDKELSIDGSSAVLKSDFKEDKILNLNVR